jgi:hypothetical protein
MRFGKNIAGIAREQISIAPLITFRVLFGALMLYGVLRFAQRGWIERCYIEPDFMFKFYGFEWVQPLSSAGMYFVFAAMALGALGIMLGFMYRFSTAVFLLSFTYVELLDATYYLNHYYLVVLLAFLLLWLPANRAFSLDVWLQARLRRTTVPAWCIYILMLQVGLVYFFAGLAKLNPDWLLRAMPLAVWLPANIGVPPLQSFFENSTAAYLFSWAGALYDLAIPFLLLFRKTRGVAYLAVIGFHLITGWLFNIGLFPFIMIFNTLIFFSADFHRRLLSRIGYREEKTLVTPFTYSKSFRPILSGVLGAYLVIQLLMPFRHVLYPGNLLWTEEGYRFSWRVMLAEKTAQATFYIQDPDTGRRAEVDNSKYLSTVQEKQMAFQPDMILQYAHFLAEKYRSEYQIDQPIITVDCHVALNGRSSRRLIDPTVNLAKEQNSWKPKNWILPFRQKTQHQ